SSTGSPGTRPSTSPSTGSRRSWSAPGRRSSRPRRTERPDDRRAAGLVSSSRPRVRTWRRTLRALALDGRARVAHLGAASAIGRTPHVDRSADAAAPDDAASHAKVPHRSLGPHAVAHALDRGPLTPEVLRRPRQGRLGDCWLMAPLLALHETAPERLRALVGAEED